MDCRERGPDEKVFLWTVSDLTAAAKQYRAAGFRKAEQKRGRIWGRELVEEKYELSLW